MFGKNFNFISKMYVTEISGTSILTSNELFSNLKNESVLPKYGRCKNVPSKKIQIVKMLTL